MMLWQTVMGWFLCFFGRHDLQYIGGVEADYGITEQLGYCLRCGAVYA